MTVTAEAPPVAPSSERLARLIRRPVAGELRSTGPRVIKFIERHCVLTSGEFIGRPFRLMGWQKRMILELFENEFDETAEEWLRRHAWALIGIPKKNGKTELAAALGLYFLLADGEPAPVVLCAAASEEQAGRIFNAAATMCELSPTLKNLTNVYRGNGVIEVPSSPGAEFRRVAASEGLQDGYNVHAAILDELHEWADGKGSQTWDVITNGTVARRQPMVLQITTAGDDEEAVWFRQYEYGRDVAEGRVVDSSFFMWWYEATEAGRARFDDPAVWEAVNPSYGITVHADGFRKQLPPKKRLSTFIRYFLNVKVDSIASWLDEHPGAWDRCETERRSGLPPAGNAEVFVAVDSSTKRDSTAIVHGWWRTDRHHRRRLALVARIWARPRGADGRPLKGWKVPIGEVEEYLRELWRDLEVQSIGYDPAYFYRSADALEAEGLPMEEVPQTDSRMAPAAQALYELIVDGIAEHDGDELLARHINGAVATGTRGGDGAWRLRKSKSSRKIDAAVAASMVCFAATQTESEEEYAPLVTRV